MSMVFYLLVFFGMRPLASVAERNAYDTPFFVSDNNGVVDEEEPDELERQNPSQLQEVISGVLGPRDTPLLLLTFRCLVMYWYIKVIQIYLLFSRESRLAQGFLGGALRVLQTTEVIFVFLALVRPLVDEEFGKTYWAV